MKSTIILILAVIVVAAFGKVTAPAGERMPEAGTDSSNIMEFRQLAEKWRLAYNSKDTATLATMYTKDAEYISAHVDGYVAHGRDRVIANFKKGAESGGRLDNVEVLSVHSSGDMATVVTKYVGIAGGKKVNGRNLLVCKHIDGRWMIVTHMTVVRD